jgi:translation initiation factor 3 subunit A
VFLTRLKILISIIILLQERQAAFDKKLSDYNKQIEEQRVARLLERKEGRKEDRRQKWIHEQEEERQRKADEELVRQREEKERLELERKEREEEEYQKKKEVIILLKYNINFYVN